MAIVLSVLKWRHYFLGRHFTIKTDEQSLKFLMEQREIGPAYLRWVSKLLGYTFDISYRSGVTNIVADAVSKQGGEEPELNEVHFSSTFSWEEWLPKVQQDPFIQQLTEDIQQNRAHPLGYTIQHGLLMYKGRIVLPNTSTLISLLLKEYHDGHQGGHYGDHKTYQRLAKE